MVEKRSPGREHFSVKGMYPKPREIKDDDRWSLASRADRVKFCSTIPDSFCQSISPAPRLIPHNVLYLVSNPRYPLLIDSTLIPSAVKEGRAIVAVGDLTTDEKVAAFLSRLLPVTKDGKHGPVAALLPWVCDRLLSPHSRRAYASDLRSKI